MSEPLSGFHAAAVLIGASTGGPPLVEGILRVLPADFPAPIAVCQHMSPGFVEGWAQRLDPLCWLRVKVAEDGERFERGTVYLAQAGYHLRLFGDARVAFLRLEKPRPDSPVVPSVDALFTSGAEVFGSRALGVVLTGTGSDGAVGLLALREAGAYTLIEQPQSAVASGMPGSAAGLGAAIEAVPAAELPGVLLKRAMGDF